VQIDKQNSFDNDKNRNANEIDISNVQPNSFQLSGTKIFAKFNKQQTLMFI